jgi:hypothetical protein
LLRDGQAWQWQRDLVVRALTEALTNDPSHAQTHDSARKSQ